MYNYQLKADNITEIPVNLGAYGGLKTAVSQFSTDGAALQTYLSSPPGPEGASVGGGAPEILMERRVNPSTWPLFTSPILSFLMELFPFLQAYQTPSYFQSKTLLKEPPQPRFTRRHDIFYMVIVK